MNELFKAGKVRPVIDGPYRLDRCQEAFSLFAHGAHKGKVVLTMQETSSLVI